MVLTTVTVQNCAAQHTSTQCDNVPAPRTVVRDARRRCPAPGSARLEHHGNRATCTQTGSWLTVGWLVKLLVAAVAVTLILR
jgi:hypothetical protein